MAKNPNELFGERIVDESTEIVSMMYDLGNVKLTEEDLASVRERFVNTEDKE